MHEMRLKPGALQRDKFKEAPGDASRNGHGAEESRFVQHDGVDLNPVVGIALGYPRNMSASCLCTDPDKGHF